MKKLCWYHWLQLSLLAMFTSCTSGSGGFYNGYGGYGGAGVPLYDHYAASFLGGRGYLTAGFDSRSVAYLDCPYPYKLAGNTCLYLPDCTNILLLFEDARAYCQNEVEFGDLATFESTCQYEDLAQFLLVEDASFTCNLWVGITDENTEGIWEVINTNGKSTLQLDDPFWVKPIVNDEAKDYGALLGPNFHRLVPSENALGVDEKTPLCQISPITRPVNLPNFPVSYQPPPRKEESFNDGNTSVTVGGASYSSDNTASFNSMPQITINTHHHHVEKHPKVIIIPTHYVPKGHGTDHHHNDPHIVVSHDPHEHSEHEHEHSGDPEHRTIDGSIHPNGLEEHKPTITDSARRRLVHKPNRPSFRNEHLVESREPYVQPNLRNRFNPYQNFETRSPPGLPLFGGPPHFGKPFLPMDGRANPLKHPKRTDITEVEEREELVNQLLNLIDKIGHEIPFNEMPFVDKNVTVTQEVYNKEVVLDKKLENSIKYLKEKK